MSLFDSFLKNQFVNVDYDGRSISLDPSESTPSNIRREFGIPHHLDFELTDGTNQFSIVGDNFSPALDGQHYEVVIRNGRQRRLSDATLTDEVPRYRPAPPQYNDYAESTIDGITGGIEFYYGEDRPITRSEKSRITHRNLAQAITARLRQTVNENDIMIFCDGKPHTDTIFSPDKTYHIHFHSQPIPHSPEVADERFIVKMDVDSLKLADLPIPLVAVGRICAALGQLEESAFKAIDFKAKTYIIFAHSLPAALQQVAFTLSAAFAYLESVKIDSRNVASQLNKTITEFLHLTRQAESELITIMEGLLASLENDRDPEFEVVKTAVTAQINAGKRTPAENRPLPRDYVKQERFREKLRNTCDKLNLITDYLNNTNVLSDAYIPFEKVVLPLLSKVTGSYHTDEIIQIVDVLIDIVYATNNSLEQYPNIYRQAARDGKITEVPEFGTITEQYNECLALFIATAPYGFINDAVYIDQLRQDLQKAQFSYAICVRANAAQC
uniref:SidC_N domain-containing protein n=1 Tax=Panagrellus redivivus TaxID=6233 RepID=A0A7E4WE93_PANRE